jgi:5-methylthioadenosine/S-adenosylhomocysteine deaminase
MSDALLVRGAYVLADPAKRGDEALVRDGAVLVEGARIAAVGPYAELRAAHGERLPEIGSPHHLVMPGMVNAHHHGVGLSDTRLGVQDSYLERWLVDAFAEPPLDPYLDVLWGDLRNLRAGVTTLLHTAYDRVGVDYEGESRAKVRAHVASGIRATYGVHVRDARLRVYDDDQALAALAPQDVGDRFLQAVAGGPPVSPQRMESLFRALREEHAGHRTVSIALAPLGAQWSTDETLATVRRLATETGCAIHMHCLETRQQRAFAARAYGGRSMVEQLDHAGFLDGQVTLGHAVWLTERDAELVAERGVSVVHNAGSNLRLGSGIQPLPELCSCGVNVAIGLDGLTLGDDEDMLAELRLVQALHRLPRDTAPPSPGVSPAHVVELATVGGARTLGLEREIGRLAPGMRADLITLDLDRLRAPYVAPSVDPLTILVQRGRLGDVEDVVVDGRVLLRGGAFTHVDEAATIEQLVAGARLHEDAPPDAFRAVMAEIAPYVDAFFARDETDRQNHDGWTDVNRRR